LGNKCVVIYIGGGVLGLTSLYMTIYSIYYISSKIKIFVTMASFCHFVSFLSKRNSY